jgi:hypothetical protein
MTKVDSASILKLSDRGISILQGLATITAEQELRDEQNLARIEGSQATREPSGSIWLRVRNVFARMLG